MNRYYSDLTGPMTVTERATAVQTLRNLLEARDANHEPLLTGSRRDYVFHLLDKALGIDSDVICVNRSDIRAVLDGKVTGRIGCYVTPEELLRRLVD